MKKILKNNKLSSNESNLENSEGLGASHQRFLNKFGKKAEATAMEASTSQQAAAPSDRLNLAKTAPAQTDYYSPPASRVEEEQAVASFNTSTWYALNGRIGRIQFAAFGTIWGLIVVLIVILAFTLGIGLSGRAFDLVLLTLLILPIFIYSYLVLPKRRLHDLNKSGWWLLLALIPAVNVVFMIYLYFVKGDEGINDFGLPPEPFTNIQLVLAILFYLFMSIGILAPVVAPSLYTNSLNTDAINIEELGMESDSAGVPKASSTSTASPAISSEPLAANDNTTLVTDEVDLEDNSSSQAENERDNGLALNENENRNEMAAADGNLNTSSDSNVTISDSDPEISYEEFKQQAETQIFRESD